MAQSEGLTPLRKVFERAKARGLSADETVWAQLVGAGFDLQIKRSGQHLYGIDQQTEAHLYELLAIKQRLPGRFRSGALAFELAVAGSKKAPANLVRGEVCHRVYGTYGFVRRELRRHLGLSVNLKSVTRKQVRDAAKRAAKNATRYIKKPWARNLAMLGWGFLFSRLLGIAYFYEDVRVNARPFDELLTIFARRAQNSRFAWTQAALSAWRSIVWLVADFREVGTLDTSKNLLFKALNDTKNRDDATLLDLCTLVAPTVRSVLVALYFIAPVLPKTMMARFTWWQIYYYMSGVCVAMLYTYRHSTATKRVLDDLRVGKDPAHEIIPIAVYIARRFSQESNYDNLIKS